MDPDTRERAVAKVREVVVRAVHPTHWRPEPFAHRLAPDRWLRNINLVRLYRSERNFALWKSRDPLDRDAIQRFGQPLSTVNAYYSPVTNTITVFAGILLPPFYDDRFSEVAAYARIGTVIGHELAHAMDNHGRMFDHLGNYRDWWAPESARAFQERAQCIAREYSAPHGCDNLQYGNQTLGEDIADIIGVTLAHRALQRAGTGGTDDERVFFQAFAQQWCARYDRDAVCNRVNEDVHAVPEMRVDRTLRQLPAFQRAFQCADTHPMVNPQPCVLYGGGGGKPQSA
jgi:predicted metalloendopeptidase